MCRSIAEGGRRCPSSGGGAGGQLAGIGAGSRSVKNVPLEEQKIETLQPPTDDTAHNPELNQATPFFNQLLTTSSEEWFNTPWKERKTVTEQALREVITLAGSEAVFAGWNRRKTALGTAFVSTDYITGLTRRSIQLSDAANRYSEPITLADTIAHEVAHTIASPNAGHGPEWVKQFDDLKKELNLNTETKSTHTPSEAETAELNKMREQQRQNAPWVGKCPQGHTFTAGRKPKYGHLCVQCRQKGLQAEITYERNQNRGGKK